MYICRTIAIHMLSYVANEMMKLIYPPMYVRKPVTKLKQVYLRTHMVKGLTSEIFLCIKQKPFNPVI